MTTLNKVDVENCLKSVIDPNVETDLVSAQFVRAIDIDGADVTIRLEIGYPAKSCLESLVAQVKTQLQSLPDVGAVNVDAQINIISHSVQQSLKPISDVKNIIAVASGKGGVGKSTTAVNLALALAAEGGNVGILDADIYGPSIPTMLGLSGAPESDDGKAMIPKTAYGIQTISIGYLIDQGQPMIWRGPMVTSALQQLLQQTKWQDLDYLIVDLPPGTGDIQLSLSQQIPVSGAVIVTTPQDIALLDAQRGLAMFEKVNIPILGIVENMSLHICSNCGHEEAIFGVGGGEAMAKDAGANFLGSLPLEMEIRTDVDEGVPTVAKDPEGRIAEIYKEIARKVSAKLTQQDKAISAFPSITIE